jgi:hypothetical protein
LRDRWRWQSAGLSAINPGSFHAYMQRYLFDQVNVAKERRKSGWIGPRPRG